MSEAALSLRITAVNIEWERTFANVSIDAQIKTVKKLIASSISAAATIGAAHISPSIDISRVLLLYKGAAVPFDDLKLRYVIEQSERIVQLHIMLLDDSSAILSCMPLTYEMDPASYLSARSWIDATSSHCNCCCSDNIEDLDIAQRAVEFHNSITKNRALSRVMGAFEHQRASFDAHAAATINHQPQQQSTDNSTAAADANAAVDAQQLTIEQNAQQQQDDREQQQERRFHNLPNVRWFHWSLILKLIATSFLFTYNRHMRTDRMIGVASVATLIYFVQIGAFYYWFRLLCVYMGVEDFAQGQEQPQNPLEAANADAADIDNPAAADAAQQQQQPAAPLVARISWVQFIGNVAENGISIPTAPGLLLDISALVMGFFCSLLPNWNPVRRPHLL